MWTDDTFFWHEGDWEMMQIAVSELDTTSASLKAKWMEPRSATASQHYQGQTLRWDSVGNGPGTRNQDFVGKAGVYRPDVYIALNTHATYFSPNMWFRFGTGPGASGWPYQASPQWNQIDDRTGNTAYSYSLQYLHGHTLAAWQGFWGKTGGVDHGPRGPGWSEYGTTGQRKFANPRGFNNFYLKSGTDNTDDPAFIP